MNTNDFVLIQTLYEYQNISRTAEALYLAQPTVSKRLQLIEEEFGTVLVRRGKHGVEFTPEGEYLAVKASQINAILADTRHHLEQMKQETQMKLVIGASDATIHSSFPDLIREFQARYPKIHIELVNEKSTKLTRLLEQEKLDFGFVTGEVRFNGERIKFRREKAYLGSAEELDLSKLPEYPYLDYLIDPASKNILGKWWSAHYAQPFPSGLHVSSAEVARDLVLRGLGYSFFFREDFFQDMCGIVTPLLNLDGAPVVRDNWCLYYGNRLCGRREATLFLGFMEEKCGLAAADNHKEDE